MLTFEQFVKKIGNDFQQYHWSFDIDDGLFIASCDSGVVCYNPRTNSWTIGVVL